MQVVTAIREYSPELDVEWVPPVNRKPGVAAFKIIHKPLDGDPYTIFHVKTEEEFDTRVLMRLIAGDQRFGDKQTYSMLEAAEKAAKLVGFQRYMDEMEEASEKAYALMKTNKTTYKFDDDHIFRDDTPGNVAKDHKPRIL
jgi:hypothetical protein